MGAPPGPSGGRRAGIVRTGEDVVFLTVRSCSKSPCFLSLLTSKRLSLFASDPSNPPCLDGTQFRTCSRDGRAKQVWRGQDAEIKKPAHYEDERV